MPGQRQISRAASGGSARLEQRADPGRRVAEIVERPRPAIFNNSFRLFLRRIEHDHVVEQWEGEDGDGLWVVAGRLIASSLIAGGLFYLTTQDFSVDSLFPVVSGTGLFGAPVVRALLARVTMRGASLISA